MIVNIAAHLTKASDPPAIEFWTMWLFDLIHKGVSYPP